MWVPPQVPASQQCFSHTSISTPFFTSLLPSCNALCLSHEKVVLSAAHWLILKKISYLSKRFHADLWGKNAKSSFSPWFMPLVNDYCFVVWTLQIVFSSPCSVIFREMSLQFLLGPASTGKTSSGLQGVVAISHAGINSPSTLEKFHDASPDLPLCSICADSQWFIDRGKGQTVTSVLPASPGMVLFSAGRRGTVSQERTADTSLHWRGHTWGV